MFLLVFFKVFTTKEIHFLHPFGSEEIADWTAMGSSLMSNCYPRKTCLSAEKRKKSRGAKSGLYGSRTSNERLLMTSCVAAA